MTSVVPTLLIGMSEPFEGLAHQGCRVWLSVVCRPYGFVRFAARHPPTTLLLIRNAE